MLLNAAWKSVINQPYCFCLKLLKSHGSCSQMESVWFAKCKGVVSMFAVWIEDSEESQCRLFRFNFLESKIFSFSPICFSNRKSSKWKTSISQTSNRWGPPEIKRRWISHNIKSDTWAWGENINSFQSKVWGINWFIDCLIWFTWIIGKQCCNPS